MSTGRIQAAWVDLAADVLPADAPEIQCREMRRAFFAGVGMMFALSIEVAYMSEDDAVAVLQDVSGELDDFIADRAILARTE